MSYNVGIKNRFAELDSDVEAAPAQHVLEKVATEAPVAPKARQERPARNGDRAQRGDAPRRPRNNEDRPARAEGQERPARGPRKPRVETENTENAVAETSDNVEGKPRHNNRRGRGRAAPRSGPHDGFERHSTNFNQKMKKGGAGAHNWGKDGETQKVETPVEAAEETPVEVVATEEPVAEVEQVEAKPVEKVYTYGDYMKDLESKRIPKKAAAVATTEITETIENGKFKIHVKSRDEKEKVESENKPVNNKSVHLFEYIQAQGGKIPTMAPKDDRRRDNRRPRDNNNRRNNAPRTKPINFDAAAFPAL